MQSRINHIAVALGLGVSACGDIDEERAAADDASEDAASDEASEEPEFRAGTPTWPIVGVSVGDCYHTPGSGAHKPSGGLFNADDTFALDLNCSGGSEGGKSVVPIRPGTVKQVNAANGWVLVEHAESLDVDGISHARFYTGYMHMSNLAVSEGQAVTTATTLGKVSGVPAGTPTHLHFATYVGNWPSSYSSSRNGRLISFNPKLLGGSFAAFDYSPYVWRAWVDDGSSAGSYLFAALGTLSDVYSDWTCGLRGSTKYTYTKAAPDDNRFEFKVNTLTPVTSSNYYSWPFINSCRGTTSNAVYSVLSGTSTATANQSVVVTLPKVDQNNIYDDYAQLPKFGLSAGRYVTTRVGDGTGETNPARMLTGDQVLLWRKADHCLGACSKAPNSEKDYCLQSSYNTSGPATDCTVTVSLPAGW